MMRQAREAAAPGSGLPLPFETVQAALTAGVRDAVRDWRELDDLVQSAWVALLERLPRLGRVPEAKLEGYIRRIARNATIDSLRRDQALKRGGQVKSLPAHDVRSLSSASPDPERAAMDRQKLRRVLAKAGGRSQLAPRVLALVFLRGMAPDLAARELGVTPGTIYSTLYRARRRLGVRG